MGWGLVNLSSLTCPIHWTYLWSPSSICVALPIIHIGSVALFIIIHIASFDLSIIHIGSLLFSRVGGACLEALGVDLVSQLASLRLERRVSSVFLNYDFHLKILRFSLVSICQKRQTTKCCSSSGGVITDLEIYFSCEVWIFSSTGEINGRASAPKSLVRL